MLASELQARLADTIARFGDINVALIVTPESGPSIVATIEPSVIPDEPIELVPFLAEPRTVCIRGFAGVPVRNWHDVAQAMIAAEQR